MEEDCEMKSHRSSHSIKSIKSVKSNKECGIDKNMISNEG